MNRILLFVGLLLPLVGFSQEPDFEAANWFDAPNLQRQMGSTKIIPFFLKKSNKFWFVATDAPKGSIPNFRPMKGKKVEIGNDAIQESKTYFLEDVSTPPLNVIKNYSENYYLVDPDKKQRMLLFDKVSIVRQLEILTSKAPSKTSVIYRPDFSADEQSVEVSYNSEVYDYFYTTKKVVKRIKKDAIMRPASIIGDQSPDKKYLLYARNHNLYLRNSIDTIERQLSTDGVNLNSFSVNILKSWFTDAKWTPDSKHFYVLRKDTRNVKTLTTISSLGNPRPYVTTYEYELPGDKDVAQFAFFVGDAEKQTLKKVNIDKWPDQIVEVLPGQQNNEEVFILRKKRSRDDVELCAVNMNNGTLRVVINEGSKPFINTELFKVSLLNKGNDILMWSDRSGWGHYYHYDKSGKLLNAVTSGAWTAGAIASIDTAKRLIYFYGYGKEESRNPNYSFLYKVSFDGGKPQLLTPENATHTVFMDPKRAYFVDYFSRIDLEPTNILRTTSGKFVEEVFKPKFDALYAYGWKKPEMFTVKAQDGITDLYGLMWKPFDFDPNKKYPIISQVYPGPFTETVWTEFTVIDRYNNTALAQTGFIVVVMGHRGGSPTRNAAYYKYGFGDIRDVGLADDKFGLEQLAARYAFIDLNKLGVVGHSGGGAMSTAAICTYPNFYKVAVSSSGNHDNRLYNRNWGESYNGVDNKIAFNQSLAQNLKGHLMLVTGESDQNVNPSNTYRMVDALIKADKDFDLLVLPGQSHHYEQPYKSYFEKRLRQYFAKYLMDQPIK